MTEDSIKEARARAVNDHRRAMLMEPPVPGSLILEQRNIAAGATVKVALGGGNWREGRSFHPRKLVYAGSPDMWILSKTNIMGNGLSGVDIPCDTYRPGADLVISWPPFSVGCEVEFVVENRGASAGHFIARIAGEFDR